MPATNFEIVDRPRERASHMADIGDFHLREIDQFPAEIILENQHITLYSLDFENRRAVFVETSADVDLSQAPFYFRTQFEKAKRVVTIPFETMIQLAKSVTIDDNHLILIYSVGRCGSTLASQIFAQIPGVANISEPYVLSQLVIARNTKMAKDDELVPLLEAAICLLCKTAAETAWVVKGQSFVIELGDWLHKLYPHTKNLFLYRHAETWLRSGLRAYGRGVEATEEESRASEKQRREILGPLVPSIAQYDPNRPLPHAGTLSLMWLRAMERYVEHSNMGIEMLAIRYDSWQSDPRKTAEAMLDYCKCRPTNITAIYTTLNRDSQADTHLSRATLGQHKRVITDLELDELYRHLQNHAFIHETDFEVPNTLKI
ncbi:MAG: hypothetical protein KAV87_28600 [Desulfobacteraceae bacterium]|nr:hypothetical protein [Desulfobacteraceae bacterium]